MRVREQPQESARFQAYLSIARPGRQTPSGSALTVAAPSPILCQAHPITRWSLAGGRLSIWE